MWTIAVEKQETQMSMILRRSILVPALVVAGAVLAFIVLF